MSDQERTYLWNKRCNILYNAEVSTLYHRKRERFFALLDRWDKVFMLLFGSAAFAQLISIERHPLFALPFAVLALASLLFDFADRARKHGELASMFKMLEATIERKGERDFDESDLAIWSSRLRQIESGETAAYVVLVRLCQNEIARAMNNSQDITRIPVWRALLANLCMFQNYRVQQQYPSKA